MRSGVKRKKSIENVLSKYFIKHLAIILIIFALAALCSVEVVSRLNFEVELEKDSGNYDLFAVKDVTMPNSEERWLAVYAISDSDNLDATSRKIARKQFKKQLWNDRAYDKIYVFVWEPDNVETYVIANYVYIWNK